MQWPELSYTSSLIGGSRLFNTLLSIMLSIAVLKNEVYIAYSVAFFELDSDSNTAVLFMSVECYLHFPQW